MRALLFASVMAAGLLGCSDPFSEAQEADTIEAYETYLKENPDGRFALQASSRLETLMLEKAKEERSLAAYDAYLARFPEGALREQATEDREDLLYNDAKATNTKEAWESFLEQYPKAEKSRKQFAKRMLRIHEYLPKLELSPVRMEQINLAEDPEGPLNGWGFYVDVANKGSKTLSDLSLTIQYLSPEGGVLGEREWPMVAAYWRVPVREERKQPFRPGEEREWEWTTGDLPDRWDRQVRVFVSRLTEAE